MLRPALAGLLATGAMLGCNSIFGIDGPELRPADAGIDGMPDAPLPRMALTWQVATTLATGAPDPTIHYPPISPAPEIKIAKGSDPLHAVMYHDDGGIEIPADYPGFPWRLSYKLGSGIEHEFQWNLGSAHLVIPVFGRLDPASPPSASSGYSITPSGIPSTYAYTGNPHLYTAGVFSDTTLTPGANTSTFNEQIGSLTPVSGPAGAPDPDLGDWALLVEREPSGACSRSKGTGFFDAVVLSPSGLSPVAPPWNNTLHASMATQIDTSVSTRIFAVFTGNMAGTNTSRMVYGFGTNLAMPAFTQTTAGNSLLGPLMVTLVDCNNIQNTPQFADAPEVRAKLPDIIHAQYMSTRTVSGGPTLTSGAQVVADTFVGTSDVPFDAPFVTSVLFDATIELIKNTTSDGIPYTRPATPRMIPVTFMPENSSANDYVITVHRVTGTTLTPVRVYTVLSPSVQIDSSLLTDGQYVLEIRARVGYPNAASANYETVQYPMGDTTTFTRTFTVSG